MSPAISSCGGSLLFGVAVALVVSTLTWLARGAIGGILGAAMSKLLASHRHVRGTWQATYQRDGTSIEEHITLKQFLHRIWGTARQAQGSRTYRIQGKFHDPLLTAIYELKERSTELDRGTFTLRLDDSGDVMNGGFSWLATGQTTPGHGSYTWRRVKDS
jgi:hypothetical protein